MKKLNVILRIVTPLFMGGANQQPELRTQSFNGVFRYWFRLAGGSFEDEKRLFGWAGEKSNKGLINILVDSKDLKTMRFSKQFDKSGYIDKRFGINYLGFSLDQRFKEKDHKSQRECFTGGYFKIRILFHPKATNEDIKKFLSILWLAFNLGNFGSRSRRGFGSIMIKDIRGDILPDFKLSFNPDVNNLSNWFKDNLKIIKSVIYDRPRNGIPCVFDNDNFQIWKVLNYRPKKLQNWIKKVQNGRKGRYLSNQWKIQKISNQMELLDYMGFLLMAFRSYYQPDYDIAKGAISGRISNRSIDIKRIAFGLPLQFYFSSLGKSVMIMPKSRQGKLRRASPLLFKIILSDKSFTGLFIFMKSKFLPDNANLTLNKLKVNFPTWEVIDEFLTSLKNDNIVEKIYT